MVGFDLVLLMRCVMKIRMSFLALSIAISFSYSMGAYASNNHIYLDNQIKPNLMTSSKPTYIKLAAVHFLSQNTHSFNKNLEFGCREGFIRGDSGSGCVPNPCDGFPYASKPLTEMCSKSSACLSGDTPKYSCTCNEGWKQQTDGSCLQNTCATNVYPYSAEPSSNLGNIITCKSGTNTLYGYSACNSGWYLNSGKCVENPCDGYTSSTAAITGCSATNSCQKGTNKLYTCMGCYTGYSLSGGSCSKTCTYTATALPTNCANADSCVLGSAAGNKTYYAAACSTCNTGYALSNTGKCSQYTVGDVVYHNGTAIGVVFYVSGAQVRAVALNGINSSGQASATPRMNWSTTGYGEYDKVSGYDVTDLANITSEATAKSDMNGKSNTQKMLAYTTATGNKTTAGTACSLYAPTACTTGSFCAKGNWYLPALGELTTIYNNLTKIQNAISSAGGTSLPCGNGECLLSSNEYGGGLGWVIYLGDGGYSHGNNPKNMVRPVLQF